MRHCAECWPIFCQFFPATFWGCGKFAVCPRRSWFQERRSDSQGRFLVKWGGLHANDPRPAFASVHVRPITVLRQRRWISCGRFSRVSVTPEEVSEVRGWRAEGLRPGARQDEERTVDVAPGWQHKATEAVLTEFGEGPFDTSRRSFRRIYVRGAIHQFHQKPDFKIQFVCFSGVLSRRFWFFLFFCTQVPAISELVPLWSECWAAGNFLGVSFCTCVSSGGARVSTNVFVQESLVRL